MPTGPRIPLADLLRQHRLAGGLTIEQLATRAAMSDRAVSDLERGVSTAPRRRTVAALAAALGLDDEQRAALEAAAVATPRTRTGSMTRRLPNVPPHPVSDFTGREAELRVIADCVTDGSGSRLVVLCGPPGVGKTTTAIEGARRAGADVLFVDLDGLDSVPLTPLQVVHVLLRQLPGVGDQLPRSADASAALWRSLAAQHRPTVVLDNAANEGQVRPVLAAPDRGTVIVTSRRALAGLEDARRITLGPLHADEGVRLLERIVPVDQRSDGDLAELAELARLCDDVPLALRIAGNRVASRPDWRVQDMVVRLRSEERRLRDLVAGDLAVSAAFALSYDLLPDDTAAQFRAISVIEGDDFDARTAALVADVDVLDAQDRLDELADLGLLEARRSGRYRLHDLIRLFALERLRSSGPETEVAHRHRLRTGLLTLLERAGAWFEPGRDGGLAAADGSGFPDQDTARAWIEREWRHWWPAYTATAASGADRVVLDVADALHWFSDLWIPWGHWYEFFALSAEAARRLDDLRLEAMHLGYLSWAALIERADPIGARALAQRAGAAAVRAGDRGQEGWALFYEAWALSGAGAGARLDPVPSSDHREASDIAARAVSAFADAGDRDGAQQAVGLLADALLKAGDDERAVVVLSGLVDDAREARSGPDVSVATLTLTSALNSLAVALTRLGRTDEAVDAALEAGRVSAELGFRFGVVVAGRSRGDALLAAGRTAEADQVFAGALATLGDEQDGLAVHLRAGLRERRERIAEGAEV